MHTREHKCPEARRRHQTHWKQNYQWLWAPWYRWWLLGTELTSSRGEQALLTAEPSLHHPHPIFFFLLRQIRPHCIVLGWLWIHRDPPAYATRALGFKAEKAFFFFSPVFGTVEQHLTISPGSSGTHYYRPGWSQTHSTSRVLGSKVCATLTR